MNADIAFEILRYFEPIERCRLRLINRSFNEACLAWWRRTSSEINISNFLAINSLYHYKALSFMRFISKYCWRSARYLRNFIVNGRLMDDMFKADDLKKLFGSLEGLELRCLQMNDYDSLARFLQLFRTSPLMELKLFGRYPMTIDSWYSDETELCASVVDLTRLRYFRLEDMEIKGALLTALNKDLVELVIINCPEMDESNIATMAAWCTNLERFRFVDIGLSLDTFRTLCRLSRLRTFKIILNSQICITLDWITCICDNDSIENATITGRLEEGIDFGELLDQSPWPMMIGSGTSPDAYCLALENPNQYDLSAEDE